MITLRAKFLAAFLAGVLCTLGVLMVRDFANAVSFRLDRIENYLAAQQLMRQGVPQSAPQPRKESHKGELSKPQQWKV